MVPYMLLIQSALQNRQAQEAKKAERKDKIVRLYAKNAAKYGYPTEGLEGEYEAQQERDAEKAQKQQAAMAIIQSALGGLFNKGQQPAQKEPFPNANNLGTMTQDKASDEARLGYFRMGRERGLW